MIQEHSSATSNEAAFLRHLRDLISPPAGREPYTPMTPFERETLNSIGARLMLLSAASLPSATPSTTVQEAAMWRVWKRKFEGSYAGHKMLQDVEIEISEKGIA